MQMYVRAALIASLFLACDTVAARQWITRDGRYRIEAELLAVEEGQVVLRRQDGPVIRVPLDRLSFSDVKYVNDAVQASAAVSTIVTKSSQVARPALEEPAAVVEPGTPPLADSNMSGWQVVHDPTRLGFGLKPGDSVDIKVGTGPLVTLVLFPAVPSPFVMLGGRNVDDTRQVWDLRTGSISGSLKAHFYEHDKSALSPDGQHFALLNTEDRDGIQIWSLTSGKVVQTIELPGKSPSVQMVDFAGPNRVVIGDSRANAYFIFDIRSGKEICRIDTEPVNSRRSYAISPGGSFLAAYFRSDQRLEVYDTRNGIRAGTLGVDIGRYTDSACLVFSPDGKELACWFGNDSKTSLQVWDMTSGQRVLTRHFEKHPVEQFGYTGYSGREIDWLADGSGWLLHGVVILDRATGKIVWQDEGSLGKTGVLPRRMVDASRMLAFSGEREEHTLRLVSFADDEIAEARKLVAAGGEAADIGLPPVTQANVEGIRKMLPQDVAWAYRAAPVLLPDAARSRDRLALGPGSFDRLQTFFSRPDAARIVVHHTGSIDVTLGKVSLRPSDLYQLHDLCTGKKVAQFAAPFKTNLLDLSPNGKLGLFRIEPDQDRLDIWDLETGKHVLAFRPFAEEEGRGRLVKWACFLDEEHVMTESSTSRLIAWELPECRALYGYPTNKGSIVGMTRDRRVLFLLSDGNTPRMIDTSTGTPLGTLASFEEGKPGVHTESDLSRDERRMASLFVGSGGATVTVWDLNDGSRLQQVALPMRPWGLVWCGDDYVLLEGKPGKEEFESLLDVERGLIVWNYRMSARADLWDSPDGRHWYLHCPSYPKPTELAAAVLPDAETKALLTQDAFPKPLFGPGATVSLETRIEGVPRNLPPGWEDLESVEEGLRDHFSRQLQGRQIRVADGAPARLLIEITYQKKKQSQDSALTPLDEIRSALAAAADLTPYVALFEAAGNRLWERKYVHVEGSEIALFEGLAPGSNLSQHLQLKRWEEAVRWLRSAGVPYLIYPPSAQRGFGDSVITPDGSHVLRKPGKANR